MFFLLPRDIPTCRNFNHQERPNFVELYNHYLQQTSANILHWSPEDDSLSSAVGVLGAPLEEAHELHLDLQEKYIS